MSSLPTDLVAAKADVAAWMDAVRRMDAMEVEPQTLSASAAWSLADGEIRHRSGRYFSIVGLAWDGVNPGADAFIRQEETGVLGFILRRGPSGPELLVGAKAEPGNLGFVQLSPTCQATQSNLDRVHGGEAPPYAASFSADGLARAQVISDSLQSEHGWRFFRKRNRNLVIEDATPPEGPTHKWLPTRTVLRLLRQDHCFNVDARSVLVSADWRRLTGGAPFSDPDPYTQALARSYEAPQRAQAMATLQRRLEAARTAKTAPQIIPISALAGWRFDPTAPVTLSNGRRHIFHIGVRSRTRETSRWDQPILSEEGVTVHDLLCADGADGLEFAFAPEWQPGLIARAELTPSRTHAAASVETPAPLSPGESLLLQTAQAEEGGRFNRDVALYRLIQVERAQAADERLVWLTLSEVQTAAQRGLLSNETRTALSLVVSHA